MKGSPVPEPPLAPVPLPPAAFCCTRRARPELAGLTIPRRRAWPVGSRVSFIPELGADEREAGGRGQGLGLGRDVVGGGLGWAARPECIHRTTRCRGAVAVGSAGGGAWGVGLSRAAWVAQGCTAWTRGRAAWQRLTRGAGEDDEGPCPCKRICDVAARRLLPHRLLRGLRNGCDDARWWCRRDEVGIRSARWSSAGMVGQEGSGLAQPPPNRRGLFDHPSGRAHRVR